MAVSPQHFTMVAGVEKVFNFDQPFSNVEVANVVASTAPIYFTTDGNPAVIGGDGCEVVTPTGYLIVPDKRGGGGRNSQVRVITAGTPSIAVAAW